jgi:predicted nicotinamide N-methyase
MVRIDWSRRFARLGLTWRIIMTGSAWAGRATTEIIRAGTQLRPVPLVPDIRLHQASDPISLWQRTELTSGRTGLDPPFWAFAWAGGLALARYLLDHPETVQGRHVIDIASGSGLVAIAAAKAGAAAVTAYDIDPVAAVAIRMNAAANGVTVLAICADVLDQDNLPASGADLVLVADAFYERDLAGKVMRFAERGHARGAAALVGDFGRAYLPRDRLTPLASYDVPGQRMLEGRDIKRTTIWALPERRATAASGEPEDPEQPPQPRSNPR